MRGCIVQRGLNSWAVVLYLGVDPATGQKKQKWHSVRGKRTDAEKELTRLLRELDTREYSDCGNLTVAQHLENWLNTCARTKVNGKTYERYTEIVRKSLIPGIGHLKLSKLKPLDIQRLYSQLLDSGRKNGSGGLSARTVLHYHRTLSQALRQAVKWELVSKNPCENVEPPRPKYVEMQVFSKEEIERLLVVAAGRRYYLPILLAVYTGMRRGEILGLRWSDIDFEEKTVRVVRSLEETRNGLSMKEPKTAKARRTVAVSQSVLDALVQHKAKQAEQKALLGDAYEDKDLVCAQEDGRPVTPRNLTTGFRDLLESTGSRRIRFHDLRHTHATVLLSQNTHPKIVADRLGHSTISITMDTYSHVLPNMQQKAAQKFEDAMRVTRDMEPDDE